MSQSQSRLSRRNVFAVATGVGAVAAGASLLPAVQDAASPASPQKADPVKGGGYRLSEHVKQYYKTTLV